MNSLVKIPLILALLALLPAAGGAQGHLYTVAAPSGPNWIPPSGSWVDVKDMDLWFYQYHPGNACIGFSSETRVSSGARMFVRALVDGVTAAPSDVVYAFGEADYCRMFQFSANVSTGLHHVKLQTLVDESGTAWIGDRTMWVITAPTLLNIVAAPSGAFATTTTASWTDVPNMTLNINLPSPGPLVFTFGGEVTNSNGTSTSLRILVDNVVTSPTDVRIANKEDNSVHSMTFVSNALSPGSHTVKVQWRLNGTGIAYVGDRTLSIAVSNSGALATAGGIASVSAPGGPVVNTTATRMVDIPDLTLDVPVPAGSTLAIMVQGEGSVSTGRVFVSAKVDGVPCAPSDVVFMYGADYRGTQSMTFVMKNVAAGTRHIAAQWNVDDAGQTASFGERNLTVIAFPSPGPDISKGFQTLMPVAGTCPMLVLLWDPHRPTDPAPTVGTITNTVFGSYPSVADYFSTNSRNSFSLTNAGILGWFAADKPAAFYWSPDDPTDADHDGFISGHVRKWWEAITKADVSFDFASYDTNHDGVLDPRELSIVIVIPQNTPFGTKRVPAAQQFPTWKPLVVDGVRIPWIAEVYAGSPPNMGVFNHEISHLILNLPDMYFTFPFPYNAGAYSIMDATYWDAHIDPFNKIHLGWLQPTLVKQSKRYNLYAVESGGDVYILMDPARGDKEYFIVENRQRSQRYDTLLPDSGLAVWHIMEDSTVYEGLGAPSGVSAADWATIPPKDWGRRAIRLIRPIKGVPVDNSKSLWDGADPVTGYDLLSSDPNSAHAELRWHDGTPSGFAIRQISPSGSLMSAYIEVPGSMTDVTEPPSVPAACMLWQNYPNPFNPSTVINYTVAGGTNQPSGIGGVRIAVYDVLGREIEVLVNEVKAPGHYTVRFDASGLASGLYFCRMSAGSFFDTKKMLLLK